MNGEKENMWTEKRGGPGIPYLRWQRGFPAGITIWASESGRASLESRLWGSVAERSW